ncbi:helix-turn-helix transcriptional regulator [Clostridium sp. C8-1-8]|uniref:helix-turn-helix transcriptional regulator n=1 Tax=Clostridium sp. C8-1-8 TaxID=2698831 RepID=UPI00136E71B3|nr:helix-turn-helix transcriptional regulator [Clostridium sp. C8-1-8]
MEFYNPSEKIKLMRKKFRVNQAELEGANMTRAFISMMESGKRNVSRTSSKALAEKFNDIAKRISLDLNLDEEYFSRTPKEDATYYCEEQLKSEVNHDKLKELIKIATDFELDQLLAQMYKLEGELYYNEKNYKDGFLYLRKALGKYKELRDNKAQIRIYLLMGNCKNSIGDYGDAINYYEDSMSYALDETDMDNYYKANHNLALVYMYLKEYEKCLGILENTILVNSDDISFDLLVRANITKGIALYYWRRGTKNSLEVFENLVHIVRDRDDVKLSMIYNNMAECYYDLEEYDKSLEYIEKAQQIKMRVSKESLARTLNIKAKVLLKRGLYSESLLIFNLAIDLAEEYKNFDALLENYKDLVEAHEDRKEYESIVSLMNRLLETLDNYEANNGRSYAMLKLAKASVHLDKKNETVNLLGKLEKLLE